MYKVVYMNSCTEFFTDPIVLSITLLCYYIVSKFLVKKYKFTKKQIFLYTISLGFLLIFFISQQIESSTSSIQKPIVRPTKFFDLSETNISLPTKFN